MFKIYEFEFGMHKNVIEVDQRLTQKKKKNLVLNNSIQFINISQSFISDKLNKIQRCNQNKFEVNGINLVKEINKTENNELPQISWLPNMFPFSNPSFPKIFEFYLQTKHNLFNAQFIFILYIWI